MQIPNEIKMERCAGVETTGTAKFEGQTMNHKPISILSEFDRDTFMSQLHRLDPITQEAFICFLHRLAAMDDQAVLNLQHRMGSIKWQQPDELRLIGLFLMLDDEPADDEPEITEESHED